MGIDQLEIVCAVSRVQARRFGPAVQIFLCSLNVKTINFQRNEYYHNTVETGKYSRTKFLGKLTLLCAVKTN